MFEIIPVTNTMPAAADINIMLLITTGSRMGNDITSCLTFYKHNMKSIQKSRVIIANWKMSPATFIEAENLLKTVKSGIKKSDGVKIVICPPAIYLAKIKTNSNFDLGIQNIFWEDKGAYTGEISAPMAKKSGVSYAIIGHSERRQYLNETDEMVNKKIKAALKNNLKPILCVGETLEEKNQDKTSEAITNQLETALENISKFQIPDSRFYLAYEPIWAIGTGEIPTSNEVMSVALLIRKIISGLYDRQIADNLSILYGGSVTSKNASDFINGAGMNGLLIGGASLNGSEFLRIVNLVN